MVSGVLFVMLSMAQGMLMLPVHNLDMVEKVATFSLRCWFQYVNVTLASTAIPGAEFGEGSGLVYLEGLKCDGDEDSLLDCPMEVELGHSVCDHSRDVGIRCYGAYFICLVFFTNTRLSP